MRAAQLPTPIPGFPDVVHTVAVPSVILDAASRYGAKLAQALHYFHTSRIVPKGAAVKVRVLTNAEALGAEYLDRFLQTLTAEPNIQRAKTSLTGQFDYRYAIVEDAAASAFVVYFGHSTVLLLMVFCDSARYEESKARRLLERE